MDQTTSPAKPKAKPRGAPQNVREKMARLDVLAHKALRFWERTLDEDSQATTGEKIQVSKLVVEYAWGKPKQQVQVDAKVEINHKAHIEALTLLAGAALGPTIEHNPSETLGNSEHGPNPPLLANGSNPIDLVEIGGLAGLAGPTDQNPTMSIGMVEIENPPPGASGPPGGDYAIGHPPALDGKNDE